MYFLNRFRAHHLFPKANPKWRQTKMSKRTFPLKPLIAAIAGLCCAQGIASADLLGIYTFDNVDPGAATTPAIKTASSVASGYSFTQFDFNGVIDEGDGGKQGDNKDWLATRTWKTTFDDNDYVFFQVSANSLDDVIGLASLSFDYHIRNSEDPRDGRLQIWEVGGNQMGQTIELFTNVVSELGDTTWAPQATTFRSFTVDLSGYTLDTTGLQFRLQFANHSANPAIARLDNVAVTAIPEPSSIVLLGGALLTALAASRKIRKS